MTASRSRGWMGLMLLTALVAGGCIAPTGQVAMPSADDGSPVLAASTSPQPSADVSQPPSTTPAPPTATAAPTRSPAPSPTPVPPSSRFNWLPTIDPLGPDSFEVDAFVTPIVDRLPTSTEPGAAPELDPNGNPDAPDPPVLGFPEDSLLVVLHGPVVVDGVEWYLLTSAYLVIDAPTGWAPASGPDGGRLLAGAEYACPTSPMTSEDLWGEALTDGVPACYGDREITITGDLACERDRDPYVEGAAWLDDEVCRLDPTPAIYGLDADMPPGRYAVTGHFDDPQSSDCRDPDSDDPRLRISAVLNCRRLFVATSAERLAP